TDYIKNQIGGALVTRKNILSNPATPSTWRDFALDSASYIESVLSVYYAEGLFSPEDIAGIEFTCASCNAPAVQDSQGDFTFSPGLSPGTLNVGDIQFNAGDDYLWEINKYAGNAGADPGWDLIRSSGSIVIASTPANPFS